MRRSSEARHRQAVGGAPASNRRAQIGRRRFRLAPQFGYFLAGSLDLLFRHAQVFGLALLPAPRGLLQPLLREPQHVMSSLTNSSRPGVQPLLELALLLGDLRQLNLFRRHAPHMSGQTGYVEPTDPPLERL